MSIDRLIYDVLAGRRSVYLPGIGTLEVQRQGAKRISDTQLTPPQNVVALTSGEIEGAAGVIPLVAADRGVNDEEAGAIYGSWIEGARREGGTIAIDGVGELGGQGFVMDERLNAALNPEGEKPVTIEAEKKPNRLWIWILAGVLVLLLGGLWCWKKGVFCGSSKVPVVETVATPAPQPAAEPASTAAATTAIAPKSSGPRFHVIAGAFEIESNADNYMARLKREHPELTVEKIVHPSSGYNMVSIIQAPTRREASNKMNLYWDIDLYLWIYEQK